MRKGDWRDSDGNKITFFNWGNAYPLKIGSMAWMDKYGKWSDSLGCSLGCSLHAQTICLQDISSENLNKN